VIHTSNYYYNVPAIEAARKIKKVSGMDRVFFTNSGAEAVEGALKAALHNDGTGLVCHLIQHTLEIIQFCKFDMSDHGLERLTILGIARYCAVIVETVRGGGGLRPANEEFLKQVRDLCDERDILLILDYRH